MWVVDSGSTDHMSQDREVFVEFYRVSPKSRCIYIENNANWNSKGLDTCKVNLHDSCSFMLHDVLYTSEIRRNLISMSVL